MNKKSKDKERGIFMEKEKKSIIAKFKEMSTKKKIIYVCIVIIALCFILAMFSREEITTNNSKVSKEETTTNNSKISKEETINLLIQKNENNMENIISLAEYRLRNEINYLDKNKTYIFIYDYKVIDDTINFYIIASEPTTFGLEKGYYIYGYKASYTVTDDTINYITSVMNNSNNSSNAKMDDIFKINKEKTISKVIAPSNTYNEVLQLSVTPMLSDILNFVPSANTVQNNNTTNANEENNTNIESNIKNGVYNKILTSEEKEDMLIELGDISIKIEGNKITLTDIDMQCTLTGTYEIENGKLVGEYTTAEYYSHEEMKEVTQTIEDRFEFEIQENNKLYDTMGYGQFLGKCLYRNATYELVQ